MAATRSPPRILPSGDAAMTVEFGRDIDDDANQRVLALDRALARAADRRRSAKRVPTYRSLLVHYDPEQIDFDALGATADRAGAIRRNRSHGDRGAGAFRCAYGGEHGIDLDDAANTLGLSRRTKWCARHVGGDYRVAMIGFTPGLVLSQPASIRRWRCRDVTIRGC